MGDVERERDKDKEGREALFPVNLYLALQFYARRSVKGGYRVCSCSRYCLPAAFVYGSPVPCPTTPWVVGHGSGNPLEEDFFCPGRPSQ